MWDLPKGNLFLPKISLEELEYLYATENKAKPKIRLLCAIHRKKESSIDEIAQITNLKRRTIHAILHRFQERGINAKDSIKQTGRPAFLTIRQRKELVKQLEIGPPKNKTGLWSTKEVKEHIHKNYGRNLHKRTCVGTAQSFRFFSATSKTQTPQSPRRGGD